LNCSRGRITDNADVHIFCTVGVRESEKEGKEGGSRWSSRACEDGRRNIRSAGHQSGWQVAGSARQQSHTTCQQIWQWCGLSSAAYSARYW